MKTNDLMDFEFDELLEILRESLRHHQTQMILGPSTDEQFHGYRAHVCVHLLETLQPKHPCPDCILQAPVQYAVSVIAQVRTSLSSIPV